MYGYNGKYIIVGPPGTGKTHHLASVTVPKVLAEAERRGHLREGSSPVLMCSLTKAAAQEMQARIPGLPKAAIATIHAHGYRSQPGAELLDKKDLLEWNANNPSLAISVSGGGEDDVAVATGTQPGDAAAEAYHLSRHRMTPLEKLPSTVLSWAKKWSEFKSRVGKIDYTDMIELAADEPPLDPGVIIVDEAQDTSGIEWRLLQRWGRHAGAIVCVGDPWQALFVWRGADPAYLLAGRDDATHWGVLKQSYRVPAAVHRAAVKWVSQISDYSPIEYRPRTVDPADPHSDPVEGAVRRTPAVYCDLGHVIADAVTAAAAGKSVLFLGTCNRHADDIARQLRAAYVPISNPWRTAQRLWNPLIPAKGVTLSERLQALLAPSVEWFPGTPMRQWTVTEFARWSDALAVTGTLERGARPRIKAEAKSAGERNVTDWDLQTWLMPGFRRDLLGAQQADDHYNALLALWSSRLKPVSMRHANYLVNVIAQHGLGGLLDAPRIHVGTIHSVKGGEADIVYLFPDLSFLGLQAWHGAPTDRDSVVRSFYVGMTRARETLILGSPANRRCVEW